VTRTRFGQEIAALAKNAKFVFRTESFARFALFAVGSSFSGSAAGSDGTDAP